MIEIDMGGQICVCSCRSFWDSSGGERVSKLDGDFCRPTQEQGGPRRNPSLLRCRSSTSEECKRKNRKDSRERSRCREAEKRGGASNGPGLRGRRRLPASAHTESRKQTRVHAQRDVSDRCQSTHNPPLSLTFILRFLSFQ